MITKVQYANEDERTALLAQYVGKILIEEQNITEGNFLLFGDTDQDRPTVYLTVPETSFKEIQQQYANLQTENVSLREQLSLVNGNLGGFIDQYYIDNPDKA